VLACQAGGVEISIPQRSGCLRVLFTLQRQEPGMAQSIVAAVERRDVRRDHLVLGSAERAIGEVHPAGLVDGTQEVGSQAHRSKDVGDVSPHRGSLQLGVEFGNLTGCVVVLDPGDPSHEASSAERQDDVSRLLLYFHGFCRVDHLLEGITPIDDRMVRSCLDVRLHEENVFLRWHGP
jgi:hypothetical protein